MNAFNVSWTSALSMTLLHSLWQGLLIALLTWMILRLFHSRSSNVKYLVATGAMFSLFAAVIITFFLIDTPVPSVEHSSSSAFSAVFAPDKAVAAAAPADYLKRALDFLYLHQSWIVMGWAMGVVIFSLRFVAGITYVNYLRYRALPVEQEWNEMVLRLSAQMKIKRVVALCESLTVHTPVVAGYLKPIVLMPVGLLSGLSMQQVEVILVHELAHIKRHDYLINFIQSLGETILFFNPFVWMISAWIRDERENCCDDRVLSEGYSPQLYAKTLVELETSREHTGGLALALTGNKNQLLNRIKRIMEHSTKNQNGKEKFIPLVLVALGLVFASWLSINPNEETDAMEQDSVKRAAVADTTKKPKVITYSRTTVITYDENGKPHEEVTESYDGEEMAEPPVPPHFDFDIAEIAPVPDFDFAMVHDTDIVPMIADMGVDLSIPPVPMMDFTLDTFPHSIHSINEDQIRAFQDQFKAQFKAQFGDFYAKNQKELDKMMADTQKKMSDFDKQWADQMETRALYDMKRAQEMAQLAPMSPLLEDKMHAATQQMKQAEMLARLSEDQIRIAEEQVRFDEEHVRRMEKNMKQFETEIKELLVKDGYIKSDEVLKDIVFNPFGEISINGKKIKESDKKKYTDIHKKYFSHADDFREEQ